MKLRVENVRYRWLKLRIANFRRLSWIESKKEIASKRERPAKFRGSKILRTKERHKEKIKKVTLRMNVREKYSEGKREREREKCWGRVSREGNAREQHDFRCKRGGKGGIVKRIVKCNNNISSDEKRKSEIVQRNWQGPGVHEKKLCRQNARDRTRRREKGRGREMERADREFRVRLCDWFVRRRETYRLKNEGSNNKV